MALNTTSGRPDTAAEINAKVDCEDLAERLGLERPTGKGNFRSPHHPDKEPSVSVFRARSGVNAGASRFKDHSTGETGGPIDMLMWARGIDFVDAVKELADMYGIRVHRPAPPGAVVAPPAPRTLAETIADACIRDAGPGRDDLVAYLEGRCISREVIDHAIKRRTLGWNTWRSPRVPEGERGHGGPAVATIVRSPMNDQVMAVDMRYTDPEKNGGQKTGSQGEKAGYPWCSDWRRLQAAHKVFVVESAINAMTIETCGIPGSAALAVRGTGTVESIDWTILRGKQVIAVFDNDRPQEHGPAAGYCPGLKAAWRLHELLTALDISCLLVDQSDWWEDEENQEGLINDINDFAKERGVDATKKALAKLESWLIPGMAGDDKRLGKPRLFLPSHDYMAYWRYRVQPDFTKFVAKVDKDSDGNEKLEYQDVCGFRVAAVSRVQIASPTSTMTGDVDHSPRTIFALSVQVPRHGARLQRRVVDDEKLHNIDVWKKLGPVFAPTPFARMLNVLERAADIGARDAVNFVGLAWRGGKLVVNEGPDCFFADPRQQCPYHELIFPSGTMTDAREVAAQFQATFRDNAAMIPLVWALGSHLKAFLGFWPHFEMQAEKGTGKTTLVKRLERALAMMTSSRQSLQTEFRQLTSLSYTSHPVGWGEMSTNKQDVINKAISNLQECYQYEHTRRGAELIDFLLCAPVLLSGEDVPVSSLVGKIVRSELTKAKRGPLIPEDLPVFPVKQWLQFLASKRKDQVLELQRSCVADLFGRCIASTSDSGAERMVANYAGVATAWELLCEFLDQPRETGDFLTSLTAEMNAHIRESAAERQPWAWIMEKLLSEIASGAFRYPYAFSEEDEVPVLCVRTGFVMAHMSQTPALREFWDGLPVKSDRVFKKQLAAAGVLATERAVERTIGHTRVGHMVALSLPALEQFGLHAVQPKRVDSGAHA
ncbi:Toprim domain-containing protein [Pseudacidovorax intermedius]|uniref:Toprim domain-containing protein n=1 Tax=Pseudacidovorax intermedius TaxID=433924 RepID=A0A370FHT3_9BURK|nr:toprim domain-containing protein [Pseudacidovorax intermedius]RDI25204.1 Toprim domain-containing protein [Pseudacidovorax intermedius]